jgi:hypothetical protein
MTKNVANNPDCPKCHADGCHVTIVVVVMYKDGRQKDEWSCNVCGHGWSVIHPQDAK